MQNGKEEQGTQWNNTENHRNFQKFCVTGEMTAQTMDDSSFTAFVLRSVQAYMIVVEVCETHTYL